MDNYSYIANAHAAYIDELYKNYQQDPESVDFGWRKFFEGYDFSVKYATDGIKSNGQKNGADSKPAPAPVAATTDADKEVQVRNLIMLTAAAATYVLKPTRCGPAKTAKRGLI